MTSSRGRRISLIYGWGGDAHQFVSSVQVEKKDADGEDDEEEARVIVVMERERELDRPIVGWTRLPSM